MAIDSPSGLTLIERPDYPTDVTVDRDGFVFVSAVREAGELPARFGAMARPEDDSGVPWSTLLFALEADRFDMRHRFVTALRADAAASRSLESYGRVLEAAFHLQFGGRGPTSDAPGFVAWLRSALGEESAQAVRAQLERGLRTFAVRDSDARLVAAGAHSVAFGLETGHVPADHVSVLYWMSSLVPEWTVVFDQVSSESDDVDDTSPHELHAWWGGQHARAPADSRGDFVDPWSCAGLINALMRDVAKRDTRIHLEVEDEACRAIAAPRSVIVRLREEGISSAEGQDDLDD